MGLRDMLTKPINLGSTVMRWTEPVWFPLRLRGDLWLRVLIMLGGWAAATGVMLALFAVNVDPPGVLTAIGLGAVFGLGPAFLLTMMLRDHVGGGVWIRRHDIYMQRQYASLAVFTGGWIEYGEWPWSTIEKCVIVPARRINRSFSVMFLTIASGTLMLGIPKKIDLKELAAFLSSKGVTVTAGQSVPERLRRPLPLAVGLSVPALAMLVFLAGAAFYVMRVDLPGGGRDNLAAQRDRFPQMPDVPAPPALSHPRPAGPANSALPSEGDTPAPGIPQVPVEIDTPLPSIPQSTPGFGFGGRPVGPGTAAEVSASPTVSTDSEGRTPSVGGTGGSPFERSDPQGRLVIGVRSRMGAWAGAARVASLEPLFESAFARGPDTIQLARDGYALGALDVSGTDFVDAVRPVFMKSTAAGLDVDDSYDGDWIGTPTEGSVTRVSGEGSAVVGFYGRGAAVLDAVGLVVDTE